MSIGTNLTVNRRRRKAITMIWMAGLAILMISLIYWEKTAILYILATLGLCGLLAVVALADLGGAEKMTVETATPDSARGLARTENSKK